MSESPTISVAIPLYNEEEVVLELLERTGRVLDDLPGGPHEIVCIDDGSRDATLPLLIQATRDDPRIVILSLSRNFGHQAALCAGLEFASGDVVVMMDGDLQDPPERIADFVEKYKAGYDVVYAVRVKRKEGFLLRLCYTFFYRFIALVSKTPLPRDSGDFSLVSRRVVDLLNQTPERHRYLRGLRSWYGFKQIGLAIEREKRFAGKAKYSWRALFRLALDGIFSFSVWPLRATALLGILAIGFSVFVAGFTLYAKLAGMEPPQGFTATILSITFFAGVQLFFLGVIGEYIGRIYEEVKGRPLYVVQKVVRESSTWTPNTRNAIAISTSVTGGGDVASD